MGLLLSTVLRLVLYGGALLVNVAASLVLVRRLGPVDYAAYQTITKRLPGYVVFVQSLFYTWVYRYTVQGVEYAPVAGLLVSLLTAVAGGLAGFLVARGLVGDTGAALLAGAALAATLVWPMVGIIIDAVRPVRSALASLLVRLLYSVGVVLLVYLWGLGLWGAFLAVLVAYSTGVLAALRWVSCCVRLSWPGLGGVRRIAAEWMRGAYSMAPVSLASLVYSADVAVAYALYGSRLVAAFFAVTSLFSVASEVFLQSFQYLHSFVLSTGDYASAVRAVRLAAFAAAPLLAYAAVYPGYYIHVVNPSYLWAEGAAPLAAYASLVLLVGGGLGQVVYGLIREQGIAAAGRLARINALYLLPPVVYVAVEYLGLVYSRGVDRDAILAWGAAFLAMSIARLLVPVLVMGRLLPGRLGGVARDVLACMVFYPAAAVLAALAFPPAGPPQPRFWDALRVLVWPVLEAYTLYALLVLAVDGFVRGSLARIARSIPAVARGRRWA